VTAAGALVELQDVTRRFDAVGGGPAPEVLRGVSLSIAAGESVSIVGPSGSGKSTLLNLIGALDQPTSGRVLVDAEDLGQKSPDELAALRSQKIGFVFQSHHLLPQCSALENVLVPTLVRPDPVRADDAPARAQALLERVGLADRVHHRPALLSGGECQRVAVVRALINRPRLVLADEPTGSLDAAAGDGLADLLCELNRDEGVALIAVTHSARLAARMSRTLELVDGRIGS
jgi:predicted ABC-type transport system involved in lysophospholipase L1 biosynthesis ATPase subunit